MMFLSVRLLEKEREVANPYPAARRGWNQVSPSDVLLPRQPRESGADNDGEEGPDVLVPFPLLCGIALSGTRPRQVKGRGRMSIGELREAMKELHSKASKYVPHLYLSTSPTLLSSFSLSPPRSDIAETLVCVLCEATGLTFSTPRELLDHIHSRPHMARERRLWDDSQALALVGELHSTQ